MISYKGFNFRSLLEARWAIFLDEIGWNWKYEAEGTFIEEDRYLPSFFIYCENESSSLWVKIKNKRPKKRALRRAMLFSIATETPIAFGVGLPSARKITNGLKGFEPFELGKRLYNNDLSLISDHSHVKAIKRSYSLDHYCFNKWGRPGIDMPQNDVDQITIDACNTAKYAMFKLKVQINEPS